MISKTYFYECLAVLDKIGIVTLPGKDSLTSGHGLSPVQHGVFNAIEMFEHPPIIKSLPWGANV